jgi:peptidoglycan hydrolase-like protein with peptidoglycan-binding domain
MVVRRTRASAVAVSLVVVAGSVAWGVGARVQSPEQAAARAAEPEASWITVPVERRVLSSTVVVRGDVLPEVSVVAGVPSSVEGAGVVTGLGPAVGEPVVEGSRLLLVSGRPVFVLEGVVPVYRSLGPGMSGEDVAQLQAALVRLGFSPDSDGTFRTATMSAVQAWYSASGVEPIWSKVSARDVQVARQALDVAEAALVEAQAALTGVAGSESELEAARLARDDAQRALDEANASKLEGVATGQVAVNNAQRALDEANASKLEAVAAGQVAVNNAQRALDEANASKLEAVAAGQVAVNNAKSAYDRVVARSARRIAERDAAAGRVQAAETALTAAFSAGDPAGVAAAQAVLSEAQAAYSALLDDVADVAGQVDEASAALLGAQTALAAAVREADNSIAASREVLTSANNALVAARRRADAAIVAAGEALAAATGSVESGSRKSDAAVVAARSALSLANTRLVEASSTAKVVAALTVVDNATRARDAAAEAYLGAVLGSGPTVALGELVFVPSFPARVRSTVSVLGPVKAGGDATTGGGGGGSGGVLVSLQAGGLVVRTLVRAGDEGLVRVGMPVELLDETTNTVYRGRVASIASDVTVDASGQRGRTAVIEATEALPDSLAGVNLRVTITAASSETEALVVPLAAVSSTAGGATRVSVLAAGRSAPVDVAVKVGISADGFVAVEPVESGGLSEGDQVVVGR